MNGAVRKERVGRGLAMRMAWVSVGLTWSVSSAMWGGSRALEHQRLSFGGRWMAAELGKEDVFAELYVPVAAHRGAFGKAVGME